MRIVIRTLIISCFLWACPSEVKPAPPPASPAAAAKDFYDGLSSDGVSRERLRAAFEWAGIPIEAASAQAKTGSPVLREFQLEVLENGYRAGTVVSLDSWARQLAASGFRSPSGEPFSLEEATAVLATLAERSGEMTSWILSSSNS